MLPAQEPPGSAIGPVRWARENLFSSWLNGILTLIVALCGLLARLAHLALVRALGLERELAAANAGRSSPRPGARGPSGACFAVIRERWKQFLFGFYPVTLYWRPTLAFVLMLVALAPVLFSGVPRKLLWFSVAFPGVAYWLLWGGSILRAARDLRRLRGRLSSPTGSSPRASAQPVSR